MADGVRRSSCAAALNVPSRAAASNVASARSGGRKGLPEICIFGGRGIRYAYPIDENPSTITEVFELFCPHVQCKHRSESKYLFFADYMIWCWAWAIACSDDQNRGKVVVINGVSDKFVADSFSQFVDRYIEDEFSVA